MVYAVRVARKEDLLKRLAFHSFHRLMKAMSSVDVPADAGNFGLMDAAVVNQIKSLGESDRYFPGLRTWVGYRQCPLVVERIKRYDDEPRVNLRGLFALAKTALLGFSRVPLLAFYGLAMFSAAIGIAALGWGVGSVLISGSAFPTWVWTTLLASFFGTVNALGIAVLGEYVSRIYDQVRNRPTFVVAETRNVGSEAKSTSGDSVEAKEEELLNELEIIKTDLDQFRSQDKAPRTSGSDKRTVL